MSGSGGARAEWHLSCSAQVPEAPVSKRTLGILATVAGSAIGWWWTTQRRSAVSRLTPARDHGVLLFDNRPMVSDHVVDF